MKKHVTTLRRVLLLVSLAVLTSQVAQAQAPGSTGPTPGTPQADPTAVPLDGGAGLLLITGVAVGLKKLRERRVYRK